MSNFECWDCLGSGVKPYYHMVDKGICYTCQGTGKTSRGVHDKKSQSYQQNISNKKLLAHLFDTINELNNEIKDKGVEFGIKLSKGKLDIELQEEVKSLVNQVNNLKEEFHQLQSKVTDVTYIL